MIISNVKKITPISFSSMMIRLGQLFLCCAALFSQFGWAAQSEKGSSKIQKSASAYPTTYYRGPEFTGRHCVALDPKPGTYQEIYMIRSFISDWVSGERRKVRVAEFFSGRLYDATLNIKREYIGTLISKSAEKEIDCLPKQSLGALGKGHPIDQAGAYLRRVRIDTSGRYGEINLNNKCDAGTKGWVDCDVGTYGLVSYDASGKEVWARLLVVRNVSDRGHPLYVLPRWYRLEDSFDNATLLSDGSAIVSYQNVMSLRFNLKDGSLFAPNPNVSVVPLDDWAKLKHVMNERWNGRSRPCGRLDKKCGPVLMKMYFYTLQDYLFPIR